ncbi:MAG: glycoside hydrolase family 3 C-terminal domain-containing protein [Acidobacteriota bacterium]|nr:glycoside hydrolase family 3 C-terminal domain-containing protein [Acidobacteriota bacterium]
MKIRLAGLTSHYQVAVVLATSMVLQAAPALSIEARITDLLARMTLDEKIGQMSQSTSIKTPLSGQIKDEIRQGRWGSFLNAGSPQDRAEAQRIARKESRLGIPLLFGRDVIHGYHTIFPIPLGQSASWDPDLIEKAAHLAAQEAFADGIRWTFAPMIDITRDPRWGRIAESLGEDPYLASRLAIAMIHGFQSDSLSSAGAIAACAKHYVGYGAAEAGREYNSAWIPEGELREVYLPPFEAATDAKVATLMPGFEALNGVPATGNQFILQRILRGEWKFKGMVVSDYTAIPEMIQHGYAANPADAARKALLAGVDMEMVSTTYFDHLKSLVQRGMVDRKTIDAAVRNILRLKFQLGLFDEDPTAPFAAPPAEALETAKRLATESVVLLKNETHILPLAKSSAKVAVIGPLADSPLDQMGTWAMDGRVADVQTPLTALRDKLGNARVLYSPGLKNSRDTARDGFEDAVQKARMAGVVLLFLGEEQILSGEAHSRAFLDLPGAQEALVDEIAKTGVPLVTIILAGRPLTFHGVAAKSTALLYGWHPGTMGGPAIVDLLFGDSVPSAKLPVTFPRTVGQVPIYYAHLPTGRPPSADELGIPLGNPVNPVGYTSKYVDVDFTPEYPFGYGLSYSAFEYSNLHLSARKLARDGHLTLSANVTNTGSLEADEIVQLYTHQEFASVSRPVRELKGFRRVHLKPGQKVTVQFELTARNLAFYNQRMQFVNEPGTVQVWIGPDSARGVEGTFALE